MTKQTTGTAPGADSDAVPPAGVSPLSGGSDTVADPVNCEHGYPVTDDCAVCEVLYEDYIQDMGAR